MSKGTIGRDATRRDAWQISKSCLWPGYAARWVPTPAVVTRFHVGCQSPAPRPGGEESVLVERLQGCGMGVVRLQALFQTQSLNYFLAF